MDNTVISLENIVQDFNKKRALNGVTTKINEGSFLGLIGSNGSGKTTLMRIMAGRLEPTSGDIKVFGKNPIDNINVLERMIYTSHNMTSFPSGKIKNIVEIFNIMFPKFDKKFANGLLEYFEIKESVSFSTLSQGMKATFNFIMALSTRCDVTMFDEPTLGMDVKVRKSVYEILLRDYAEYPRTFIISSHLISELEPILTDVLLIEKGKNILQGNIDTIRNSVLRVDGENCKILEFTKDKNVLEIKNTPLKSFAVVQENISEKIKTEAKNLNLEVSSVNLEDLFVYLTKEDKGGELECLW